MAEEWMNRCRGLAEGVVVMICPVLLALALNKVDLNGDAYGNGVPIGMIAVAGVTLISGICPLLACCFPRGFPGANYFNAVTITTLATLSSSCLLLLACLIALRIVSKPIAITFGVLCGILVLLRTVYYYYGAENAERYTEEMHSILDESHEFLTGVTGILFLGFEGLALESQGQMAEKVPVGTISFIFCAIGVCLMFLEMTPPACFTNIKQIVGLTLALDSIMAAGIFVLLLVVMYKFMQDTALLLFLAPVLIAYQLLLLVATNGNPGGNQQPCCCCVPRESMVAFNGNPGGNQQPCCCCVPRESTPPASLELTKVTFTGFLAVSVTAISNALPTKLTSCFILFAAAAIVFGLSWRLLSQKHMRKLLAHRALPDDIASSIKFASFCTHLCIVISTVLFVVMAGRASGK